MAEKRKRSPNWLAAEKNLLVEIVQRHFSIVENKKTDTITIRRKIAEWKLISDEYNSQTLYTHRTGENLKAQWESLKKTVKKEEAKKRMRFIQTGGEPPKDKSDDPIYNRILSLIELSCSRVDLFDPLENDYQYTGADSLDSQSTDSEVKEEMDTLEIQNMAHVDVIEVEPQVLVRNQVPIAVVDPDWSNYTRAGMQSPSKNQQVEDRNCTPKEMVPSKRRSDIPVSSLEFLDTKKVGATETQENISDERREAKRLYDINLLIKQEELKIKREELKQSKIRTRLLMLELKLKKKRSKLEMDIVVDNTPDS